MGAATGMGTYSRIGILEVFVNEAGMVWPEECEREIVAII